MTKNIFVGSLPFSVTEETLGQLFTQCGQVQSVSIIEEDLAEENITGINHY